MHTNPGDCCLSNFKCSVIVFAHSRVRRSVISTGRKTQRIGHTIFRSLQIGRWVNQRQHSNILSGKVILALLQVSGIVFARDVTGDGLQYLA